MYFLKLKISKSKGSERTIKKHKSVSSFLEENKSCKKENNKEVKFKVSRTIRKIKKD